MIRLTRANGKAIYVNPEHLVEVGYDEDYAQTLVSTMAGTVVEGWYVLESPEEVARKVLEWKLAMIDYRHSVGEYKMLTRNVLEELAGLEEPKNG